MDLITLELIQEYLVSTIREMRVTMIRTAYSSIIYEGHDFGCGMMDSGGNLIAQAEDSPAHVVPLNWQVQQAVERFQDDIFPGDIIMGNDPYTSGTHLNDVAMIVPFFYEEQLRAFSVVRAHWGDIGGMTPGSISGRASDIFQEGVRIPLVKIREKGRLHRALLDQILANVRIPSQREGDFHAMIACCNTGAQRLNELVKRFGPELIFNYIEALRVRSRERMRKAISVIPRGVYRFEDYFDTDNHMDRPVLVKVAVAVSGDKLIADFEGTSNQVPGPVNASLAVTTVGVFVALKALLDPESPINQGFFEPIAVRAPEGSVLNVQPPGAVGGFSEVRRRVTSVVMGALARVVPNDAVGDVKGTSNHTYIGSWNPVTARETIFYEYPSGGTGAGAAQDGNHVLRAYDEGDFPSIQPVEAIELEHALLVEESELRADSCGDGVYRGGLGIRREIRLLANEGRLSILSDRNVIPPYGVCGGRAGAPNNFYVKRKGETVKPGLIPGKVSDFHLMRDDIVVLESAGGGGYGDPTKRDPRRVAEDVRQGYITVDRAHDEYGVVIRNAEIDQSATETRRHQIRLERIQLRVVSSCDESFEHGLRICQLAPGDAKKLGGEDALLELINPRGAPLRGWVRICRESVEGTVPLDAETCEDLGVTEDDELEVRSLSGLHRMTQ